MMDLNNGIRMVKNMYLEIKYKDGTIRRKYQNGTKRWFKNGIIHRDNDLPAYIGSNGTKAWYKNGEEYVP